MLALPVVGGLDGLKASKRQNPYAQDGLKTSKRQKPYAQYGLKTLARQFSDSVFDTCLDQFLCDLGSIFPPNLAPKTY